MRTHVLCICEKRANRIYDGVEAETGTREFQASFQIIQVSQAALPRMGHIMEIYPYENDPLKPVLI